MKENDTKTLTEWLYLESDGELTEAQVSELDREASGSPEFAATRNEMARLHEMLESSRIDVLPDFQSRVMASLPPAGWSGRHPRTWWAAAAVLALLGGAAALLSGLSAAQLQPASPFVAAIAAVGDMLASSLEAGAGLIGASWQGIRLAVGEWLGGSIPNVIAFGVVVVGVNLLLVRRLRRRPRPEAASSGSKSRSVE